MARPEKVEFVTQLSTKLRSAQSVILADFNGLTVEQMTNLRGQLRKKGVDLKVIKNRLGRRALAEAKCDAMDDVLRGNTIWAFGIKDPVEPAKILLNFAKDHDKLVIKGGILESRRIDAARVTQLSKLPNREALLSQMAGILKQPSARMATVMQAGLLKVAYAMKSLGEKLEKQGAGAAS